MDQMNKRVDFIGVGVAKAGTSWITERLIAHPQIYIPKIRNIGYFAENDIEGLTTYVQGPFENYLNVFPEAQEGMVYGEYTPQYFIIMETLDRIKAVLPDVKLIISFREQVDMYQSYFNYMQSSIFKDVPDNYEDFINEELKKNRGYYSPYVRKCLDLFDRENIHFILFDDIKSEPDRVLKELYGFLGVDDSFEPPAINKSVNSGFRVRPRFLQPVFKKIAKIYLKLFPKVKFNRGLYKFYSAVFKAKSKKIPMPPEMKTRLRELFRDDIEQLEKLIDKDLSHWKNYG